MKLPSLFSSLIITTCAFFVFASCSSKNTETDLASFPEKSLQKIPIHSILVFPITSSKEKNELGYSKTREIEAGIDILTSVLEDELSQQENITFVSESQKESLMGDFQGNKIDRARHVASQLGGDAVLITTLNRFTEREGRSRAVNQPASVAFTYRLLHAETGKTLCMGVFDETQQTLFSNIFSFSKAKKRGFKWISAEELTSEGINEKFSECSYLSE